MILHVLWRLVAGLSVVVLGLFICGVLFPFWAPARRMRCVSWWSRLMLKALGIGFHPLGPAADQVTLIAANHVSWLDILAINGWRPARFVSKAEVRRWPAIGWLAAQAGTLFIERERPRDAVRVVHALAKALQAGETVAVFPEGAVGDGQVLQPFHANLLQAAVSTGTAVQPVALKFTEGGAGPSAPPSDAASFHGSIGLLESVGRVLRARGLTAWVAPAPVIEGARDRRTLAEQARNAVSEAFEGR